MSRISYSDEEDYHKKMLEWVEAQLVPETANDKPQEPIRPEPEAKK